MDGMMRPHTKNLVLMVTTSVLMVTNTGWVYSFGVCVRVHMRVRVRVLLYTLARHRTPGSQTSET